MRSFTIKMTKASRKRFTWLKDNDQLPLPLTHDDLHPFWFRVADKNVILTHEGRELAYLSDTFTPDGDAIIVHTPIAPDTMIDNAITRITHIIDKRLASANKTLMQQKREDEKRRVEERNRENEERNSKRDEVIAALKGPDVSGYLADVSRDDLIILSQTYYHGQDFISVSQLGLDAKDFKVSFDGKELCTISETPKGIGYGFTISVNKQNVSVRKLNDEITHLVRDICEINDATNVAKALAALPAPTFSVVSFCSFEPMKNIRDMEVLIKDLPDGLSIELSQNCGDNYVIVSMMSGEVRTEVLSYELACGDKGPLHNVSEESSVCFIPVDETKMKEDNASHLTDEHFYRLGSALIAALAEKYPEFDPSPYALPDHAKLADEVQGMDFGYGI